MTEISVHTYAMCLVRGRRAFSANAYAAARLPVGYAEQARAARNAPGTNVSHRSIAEWAP